jgi:hypothetical protein
MLNQKTKRTCASSDAVLAKLMKGYFMLQKMRMASSGIGVRWLLFSLFSLVLIARPLASIAQVMTTTVQGTVYEAGGQPASGTVLISWPSFTTASNQAVAAGSTSAVIGTDGLLTVNLAANQNAYPAGTYYTVIYHLNDGTVNREYWVVPAAATASIGSVRAQIEPATVAVQSVSKGYVDSSLAALTSTYVPVTGATMTGPLTLASDPTSDLQAATKRYADALAATDLPLTGGSLQGTLQVPEIVQKGPRVNVKDSDFGLGQPVAGIAVVNGSCTSAPTITIPAPQYAQDGTQSTAVGYCVNGQTEVYVGFPGGGYTASQTPSITGGGTSGATATLILAGTAGGADPSGTRGSLAAIQNAVDYAATYSEASQDMARVYIPAGAYELDGTLRVPCDVSLQGDGMAATELEPVINDDNGITVYPRIKHPNAWDCRGSISDIEIYARSGHLYTATELSILQTAGFSLRNVDVSGGGGRGISTQAGTERTFAEDIEIDTVRWPLIWSGNEQQIKKLNIAAPGASGDTVREPDGSFGYYCFGTGNCVNGEYPSNKWSGGKLIYAAGDGSTATFYIRGNSPLVSTSPIIAGQYFTVAGTTGTNLDGLYVATSVANNVTSDPSGTCTSSSECFEVQAHSSVSGAATIAAQSTTASFPSNSVTISVTSPSGFAPWATISGAGIANNTWVVAVSGNVLTLSQPTTAAESNVSLSSGPTWKPTIMPDHNAAVTFASAAGAIDDGSIKPLSYAGCFHVDTFGSSISHFYCEGYPINGQPTVNSALEYSGDPPVTSLTSPLGGSAGQFTAVTVEDNSWFQAYINDPQDVLSTNAGEIVKIVPQDYTYGNTSPSAYVPGVLRDQYELANVVMSRSNQMIILSRNVSGSTAPANTSWPAASQVAEYPQASGGYGPLLFADNHANVINPPSGNWSQGCNDDSESICGTYIIGSIPNEVSTFTTGQAGTQAGVGGADLYLLANERWGAGNSIAAEPEGAGFVKTVGRGGTVVASWGTPAIHGGYGREATAGQLLADGYVNVQGSDGAYPYASYTDLDDGLTFNTTNGGETVNHINTWAGGDPLTGAPVGSTIGLQFENSYCYWDTSSANGGHATSRWCFKGGPTASGTSSGFEYDTWSGSSWVGQFGLAPSGNGAVSLSITGNANISGKLSAAEINGEITVDGDTYTSLNNAWSAAVADANSSGQNQTIRLGPGEFNVTATLSEPSNGACVSLLGSAGAATAADTTEASTTLNVSVNLNGPIFYAGNTAQAQGCTFKDLNILGNQNATYGFQMEWFRGLMLDTVTVNDTNDEAILLGEELTTSGHQSNFLMRNVTVSYSSAKFTPANRPAYGVHLLKTAIDSYLDDVLVRNALTASVYNEGTGNTGNMIHGFGYPYTCTTAPCVNNASSSTAANASYATSYVIYDTGGGGSVWNDTYIDSPSVAGFYVGANGVSIDGGHIQWPDLTSFPSANLAYVGSDVTNGLLISDISCLGMSPTANWITYGGGSGNPPSFSSVHHLTGCGNYYQALEPAVTTGFSSGGANINDPSGAVPRVWATPLSATANEVAYSAQMYNGYEGDVFQAHFSGVKPFFNVTYQGTVRTAGGLAVSTVINTGASLTLTTANKNVIANAASGPQTLTLPSCYTAMADRMTPTGLELTIIKSDSSANPVTLQTVSSQTIDYQGTAAQTLTITSPGARSLICGPDDNWYAY